MAGAALGWTRIAVIGAWRIVCVMACALPLHAWAADASEAKKPKDVAPVIRGATILDARVLTTGAKPSGARAAHVRMRRLERAIDDMLRDTAEDLDMRLDAAPAVATGRAGLAKLATSTGKLVVLPLVRPAKPDKIWELELVAARPGARVLSLRVERGTEDEIVVRAAAMLRDLVSETPRGQAEPSRAKGPSEIAQPAKSEGRAILATNGTLYGGFIGLSLQRAAGSDDPRLLYPLIGVGAGVGLGAAIIVSGEWDVGVGDAWYLAAGAWWPAVSGHLIYGGRFADKPNATVDEAWSFGLIASTTGVTLSVVGLTHRGMGEGGAVLAHSGGALGMIVGGMAEFAVTGGTNAVPYAGMGYGGISGWLIASSTAVYFHPDAGRTLAIDLGILLGGLAGASAASPLLFGDQKPTKTRGWVAATGAGLIAGGVLAWWLSSPEDEPAAAGTGKGSLATRTLISRASLPMPAIVGSAPPPGEMGGSGLGVSWSGELW